MTQNAVALPPELHACVNEFLAHVGHIAQMSGPPQPGNDASKDANAE